MQSKIGLVVLGLACIGAVARAQLAPVPIELPKPGYEGTPANLLTIRNLEKPLGEQAPPVSGANRSDQSCQREKGIQHRDRSCGWRPHHGHRRGRNARQTETMWNSGLAFNP